MVKCIWETRFARSSYYFESMYASQTRQFTLHPNNLLKKFPSTYTGTEWIHISLNPVAFGTQPKRRRRRRIFFFRSHRCSLPSPLPSYVSFEPVHDYVCIFWRRRSVIRGTTTAFAHTHTHITHTRNVLMCSTLWRTIIMVTMYGNHGCEWVSKWVTTLVLLGPWAPLVEWHQLRTMNESGTQVRHNVCMSGM